MLENPEFNLAYIITQTIKTLISNIFSSIDNTLYPILDDLVFIDSDIMNNPSLINIIGENNSSGLVMVANSLIIGFLIYYSISYLLSHFTFSQIQRPAQLIFRLLLCVISVNFSYLLCRQLLFLNSLISLAIRSIGENIFGHEICFFALLSDLNLIVSFNVAGGALFSLDGIIKAMLSFGILNLTFSYALRYVMILVLTLISPFAFLSLILPNTSWIFRSWLKIFLSLLFLQILVPFILLISFLFSSPEPDMFSKLIYVGSIYALIKANTYLREFMGGLSTEVSSGISNIKSIFSGG